MGGFRKAWELAENLQSLGHSVLVFAPRAAKDEPGEPVPGVRFPLIDLPLIRPLWAYSCLLFLPLVSAFRHRPDVLYARSMGSIVPVLLARLLRVPLMTEVNGDSYEHHQRAGAGAGKLARIMRTEQRLFGGSDHLIPITPGLAVMLQHRYRIPPEKMTVVESGTDVDLFRPMPAESARQQIGLEPGCPCIGFLGIFLPHQGVETLIRAAARIVEQLPDLRVLLVGDGMMRAGWEDEVAELGLSENIMFTGQVPYRKVATFINAMSITVAPFRADRGEVSPLKVFDALACGRPTLVSDIPPVRDLVAACPAVIAVEPDNAEALAAAVLELLADPELCARLGREGRAWVEQYGSWRERAAAIAKAAAKLAGRR
jgi:glycosyltransferase involved in cell wall biosynthesis